MRLFLFLPLIFTLDDSNLSNADNVCNENMFSGIFHMQSVPINWICLFSIKILFSVQQFAINYVLAFQSQWILMNEWECKHNWRLLEFRCKCFEIVILFQNWDSQLAQLNWTNNVLNLKFKFWTTFIQINYCSFQLWAMFVEFKFVLTQKMHCLFENRQPFQYYHNDNGVIIHWNLPQA